MSLTRYLALEERKHIISMTPEQLLRKRASRKAYTIRSPRQTWAAYARRDAKKRAAKKGIPFELSKEHILSIMTDTCPVFGTAFNFGQNRGTQPTSPSLDRIVPSLGYIEGNVIIISTKANSIKSAYGSKELYKVADWLHELEKAFKE